MEVIRLGNIYGFDGGNYAGNVYEKNALAPTVLNMQGGGRQPMIVENVILGGMQEHQAIKKDGVCTCLTSSMGTGGGYTPMIVENEDSEIVRIKQATKDGYIECEVGGVADFSYPSSTTRRGRVQDRGNTCPAITVEGAEQICRVESQYRIRKLTPLECWRLMAFTDEDFRNAEAVNSNTQLYKQAGNSIVVSVLEAIFRQMHIQNIPSWNEEKGA